MTPKEKAEAERKVAELMASSPPSAPGSRPGIEPMVPQQRQPQLQEAKRALLDAALERYKLGQPGPQGDVLAQQVVEHTIPTTQPIDSSWSSALRRAFLPHVVAPDERPMTLAEIEANAGKLLRQAATPGLSVAETLAGRNLLTPVEEYGTPTENGALYLLRVIGTAAPAVAEETIARTPMPDVQAAQNAVAAGAGAAEVLKRFLSLSDVSEQFYGQPAGANQRVRRPTIGGDWAEGVLERMERGSGFEEDMSDAFRNKLGQEWESTGWWIGMGIDTFADWEGAIAKGPRVAKRIGDALGMLEELSPAAGRTETLWRAVRGQELNAPRFIGDPLVRDLLQGRIHPDDLPESLKPWLHEVALNEYNTEWRRVLEDENIGQNAPRATNTRSQVIDETARRVEAANAAADREAQAALGQRRFDQTLRDRELARQSRLAHGLPPSTRAMNASEWRLWSTAEHRDIEGAGYKALTGERLVGDALRVPSDARYVLRDGDRVIAQGTWSEVVGRATARPKRGLEVWDGVQRPVAQWTERGFVADHLFASPGERAAVTEMRAREPLLVKPASAVEPRPLAPSETVAHVLGYAVSRGPAGVVGIEQPTSRVADIVRKAIALRVRSTLGSERLAFLPTTAMVPREDKARVLEEATRILGIPEERMRAAVAGKAQLTAEEARRWRALAPDVDVAQPTMKDWQDARFAAINRAAGFLADARYRIEGNRTLVDRFILAFQDASVALRGPGKSWLERIPTGWIASGITKRLFEDPANRMPTVVRTLMKELRIGLSTDANTVLREIRRKGGDIRTALLETLAPYHLPHPTELEHAALVVGGGDRAAQLEALRSTWRGPKRPGWLDSKDVGEAVTGMTRWARDIRSRMAHIAQDWLLVHAALGGHDVSAESLLYEAIREVSVEEAEPVYREVVRQGIADGPATARLLAQLPGGVRPAEPSVALVQWVLATRAQGKIGQTLDRMLREGFAVSTEDPNLPALQALMLGQHRTYNPKLRRWESPFTEAALTWAEARLRDWAILPGSATSASQLKRVAGTKLLVPDFLSDEVARLTRVGVIKASTQVTPWELTNRLFVLWKQITTHGFLIPNPAHYMGQMIGLAPALVTTRGYGGAASAFATLLYRDTATVGELVKRVGGRSFPTFRGLRPDTLVTADGIPYTIDELEDVARQFGLGETRPDFEVGAQIQRLLLGETLETPTPWSRLREGVDWWQDLIQGWAGAFDLHGRMAVFVDEVKRGTPLEQAAMKAREAMLDFRELTPWEAKYGRLAFTFYAYMRKNADAYVRAFLRDPARVTSQMRLAHASLTNSGLSDIELGRMTDSDVARFTVFTDREVVNEAGRVHPLYKLNRVSSSPVGVAEALNTLTMFIPGWDTRGFLQSMNPAAQALAILLQGRRLERDIDRPWNNRIPPFLVHMPFIGDWLGDAVGIGPEPLTKYDDPLLADWDATQAAGVPAYWAAGVRYADTTPEQQDAQRRTWQELSLWIGRPLSTVEAVAKAAGWEAGDPYIDSGEQVFDALFGFKHRPVLNETEAIRRYELARESLAHEQANRVRPPEDVGPR